MGYKDPIANIDKIRKSRRDWYGRNKETEIIRIQNRQHEIVLWFREFKSTLKCGRCPEDFWACLQFHHRDPKLKDMSLAMAVRNGWGRERIMKEIDKCDVVCANCHAKIHMGDPKVWKTASKAV